MLDTWAVLAGISVLFLRVLELLQRDSFVLGTFAFLLPSNCEL